MDPLSPTTPDLIEAQLGSLSLEAKVGQLFMVYFEGSHLSDRLRTMIETYQVGGIILYAISGNLVDPVQIRGLIEEVQSLARIPLLVSIDQEGGPVVRLPAPATHFPSAMTVGATGSLDLAHQVAAATALELRSLGINVNFAPVVDVNSNPLNPIIGIRAFGGNADLVAQFGVATLQGYQEHKVIPCPKHFPGHGDTDIDSHLSLPTVHRSLAELQEVDWIPFQATIEAGAEMIMTAHVRIPALADKPATLSPDILQGWLRDHLGFDGVIITDSLTMGALTESYPPAQAAVMSFWAGADILLFGADRGFTPEVQIEAYEHLLELCKQGSIPLERLDQSVRRILTLKAKYGILGSPPNPTSLEVLGSPFHQALAYQVAQQGIQPKAGSTGIPVDPQQSLLIFWPSYLGEMSQVLRAIHPNPQVVPVSGDSSVDELTALAARYKQILWGIGDPRRLPWQRDLADGIPGQRCVGVNLGTPIEGWPEIAGWIDTYGISPATLEVLQGILRRRA